MRACRLLRRKSLIIAQLRLLKSASKLGDHGEKSAAD